MTDDARAAIRDETMRLKLATLEAAFIAESLRTAQRRFHVYVAMCALGAVACIILGVAKAPTFEVIGALADQDIEDIWRALYYLAMIAGAAASLVGLVKAPFELLAVNKYKLYQADQQHFLAKYGREI